MSQLCKVVSEADRGGEQGNINAATNDRERLNDEGTVMHWYDFICPFCYIAQDRNDILIRHGLRVVEMPFQAHPEIPERGVFFGRRSGPTYTHLKAEATAAGLTLNWPLRLPNTRRSLAVAEWVRQNQPELFAPLQRTLFAAHFALGEDLGDPNVLDKYAIQMGVDLEGLHRALEDGSAVAFVTESERIGRQLGVRGTPAWFVRGELIEGLLSSTEFLHFAEESRVEL